MRAQSCAGCRGNFRRVIAFGASAVIVVFLVGSARAVSNVRVTERVSVDSFGGQANKDSWEGAISANARFIAFHSLASDLVQGDTNAEYDVFVHDRQTGSTERVSVDSAGAQGDSGSFGPEISADGRLVAFVSDASNLVLGDTNGVQDAFVHDRQTGLTERVSIDSSGVEGNGLSAPTGVSGDGRLV